MGERKFDPARAARLNDPKRLEMLQPEAVWRAAEADSPDTVLDIGAGTGLVTAAFARLAPHARFYAADVSEQMLAFMREHVPADVADRIVPVHSSESTIPLPDGAADVVTMIGVYHELDDPPSMLREAHRLLSPGGTILIADWKHGAYVPGFGPPDSERVPAADIARALEAAGFEAVRSPDLLERFSVLVAKKA